MALAFALNRRSQVPAEQSSAFGAIAERFRRGGDLDRAVALCKEGLQKFPEHLSARVTLGWALLDQGKHDEARVELERVLRRAPDNLAAIRGLAELHDRVENSVEHIDTPAWPPPSPDAAAAAPPAAVFSPILFTPTPVADDELSAPPAVTAPPSPIDPNFSYEAVDPLSAQVETSGGTLLNAVTAPAEAVGAPVEASVAPVDVSAIPPAVATPAPLPLFDQVQAEASEAAADDNSLFLPFDAPAPIADPVAGVPIAAAPPVAAIAVEPPAEQVDVVFTTAQDDGGMAEPIGSIDPLDDFDPVLPPPTGFEVEPEPYAMEAQVVEEPQAAPSVLAYSLPAERFGGQTAEQFAIPVAQDIEPTVVTPVDAVEPVPAQVSAYVAQPEPAPIAAAEHIAAPVEQEHVAPPIAREHFAGPVEPPLTIAEPVAELEDLTLPDFEPELTPVEPAMAAVSVAATQELPEVIVDDAPILDLALSEAPVVFPVRMPVTKNQPAIVALERLLRRVETRKLNALAGSLAS